MESLYKKELTLLELDWIKLQMKETDALEDAIRLAKNLGLEAIQCVQDENNESLVNIMQDMIEREF